MSLGFIQHEWLYKKMPWQPIQQLPTPMYYCYTLLIPKLFLFLLCFPGFVELNHMLTTLLPATECKLNIWTTEAASETEERERESDDPSQGHLLLDVLKLWHSERICTSLVSPRTLIFCTHIHTSFPHKTLLEWQLPFSGPQKLLLEQWGEKKSKRNYIKPTFNDQPHWTLKGNMDVKSPTRTKQTF